MTLQISFTPSELMLISYSFGGKSNKNTRVDDITMFYQIEFLDVRRFFTSYYRKPLEERGPFGFYVWPDRICSIANCLVQ